MNNTNKDRLKEYFETLTEVPRTLKRGQIVIAKVVQVNKGEMIVDVNTRSEGVILGRELKLDDEVLKTKPGDEVLLYVIKGENEFGQPELSIRRSGTARKWYELTNAQKNDEAVSVKVIEANTGGVIVSIGGGLRGFIPTSQLDNTRIYTNVEYKDKDIAQKELQNKLGELIDKDIEVKVIEIDREKNRVILSEKLVSSPEDAIERAQTLKTIEIGSVLDGNVTGIAPYGLFINAQGLEGLVHLSEISWDKVSNPGDFYKVGDKIKVQVIGMQDSGKRIAYSIKRLQKDPWDEIINQYQIGQKVKGMVSKVVEYGAFVRIDDKVNGLIHISEMSDKLVKDPRDYVKEGDELELEIISISRKERHLGLSLKRLSSKAMKSKSKASTSSATKTEAQSDSAPELESLSKLMDE